MLQSDNDLVNALVYREDVKHAPEIYRASLFDLGRLSTTIV